MVESIYRKFLLQYGVPSFRRTKSIEILSKFRNNSIPTIGCQLGLKMINPIIFPSIKCFLYTKSQQRLNFDPNINGRKELKVETKKDINNKLMLIQHFISPKSMLGYSLSLFSSVQQYFTFIARMAFQAARPLLAFSVLGEAVKIALALIAGTSAAFLFSFVLVFEVFYFFLQCFISYVFLSMFFKAIV